MLSGSRLPPPTFLAQVTVPLCVTAMMRLATEQAFSCRVASTTCRCPTCSTTCGVRGAKSCLYFTVCVSMSFKMQAYLAQRHYTRHVFYVESHTIIRVVWQLDFLPSFLISWYVHSRNSVVEVIGDCKLELHWIRFFLGANKHVTHFVLKRAAFIATEMASYRFPSHCRSCGNRISVIFYLCGHRVTEHTHYRMLPLTNTST